jgi:D-alanyl-D-alanine carboxypeptidase (penicillin-binding protein 5/6)
MQIRFSKGILLIALASLLMGMLAFGIYKQIYKEIAGEIYDEAMTYSNIHYIPGYTAGPSITAGSAILIDGETGTVLYAKNEHMRRPPASTTKIMTALVALERGDLASIVTVSQRASRVEGSSLWLKSGQRLPLEELIEGTMLKSGNDGATAIAEHIAGTESAFVKLMNRKARQIGALNTQFKNSHGLPAAGHYSTAFDLALTARYALRHHKFADIVKKKMTTIEFESQGWTPQFHNTNKLLWSLEGADGVKTGTTSEAGYCLVSSATRDGRQLIAVVLRSGARWQDSARLLEYGFANFQLLRLYSRGQEVDRITITGGMEDSLILVAGADLKVVIPIREVELLTTEFVLKREASAPYRKYEVVGELKVTLKGEEIGSLPLLAATSIPRRTFLALSSRWIRNNIERLFESIKRIF